MSSKPLAGKFKISWPATTNCADSTQQSTDDISVSSSAWTIYRAIAAKCEDYRDITVWDYTSSTGGTLKYYEEGRDIMITFKAMIGS